MAVLWAYRLVAGGRVPVVLALLQALKKRVGRRLTRVGLGEKQEVLGMFLLCGRLLKSVLQYGSEIGGPFAAGRPGAGKDHTANEVGPVVRNHLRNEAAERKADQIDLREPERADECHRVLGHYL